jgi:hypothetical protein
MSIYLWLRWLHILAVFGFLLMHGPSVSAAFLVGRTRESSRLAALADASKATVRVAYIPLLIAIVTGVALGFLGGWWRSGWMWASVAVLVAVITWMGFRGTLPAIRLREALDQLHREGSAAGELIEARIRGIRPLELTAVGAVSMVVLLWLMAFKPF